MKKWLVGAVLLMAGLGVFAQAHTGYFDILPGYQFNTRDFTVTSGLFRAVSSGRDNWMGSLDFGWFFTDHVGLHAGYVYNPGDYHTKLYYGPFYLGTTRFSRNINIFEIGPEFIWGTTVNQGYFQLNVGHTFGGGDTKWYYNGHKYDLGNVGSNEWLWGAAIGYRHYFTETVGMALQGAYHHIQNWEVNDAWDARIGVVFRFPKRAASASSSSSRRRRLPPPPPPPPPPAPSASASASAASAGPHGPPVQLR